MDEGLIESMKQALPNYAVNCLINAGYDNITAITQMITDSSAQNSLNQIEEFILKHYPNDASCYPSTITLSTAPNFVFPPGHRILINSFIREVKGKHMLKSSKNQRKRATENPSTSVKKFKIDQPLGGSNGIDLEFIYNDIRKRIVSWQRKQDCKKLAELKEHQHYTVNCSLDSCNQMEVNILCQSCGKKYKLNQKFEANGSPIIMISNWTGHIKKCIEQKKKAQPKGPLQVSISKFMAKEQGDRSKVNEKTIVLQNDDCYISESSNSTSMASGISSHQGFQKSPSVLVKQKGIKLPHHSSEQTGLIRLGK